MEYLVFTRLRDFCLYAECNCHSENIGFKNLLKVVDHRFFRVSCLDLPETQESFFGSAWELGFVFCSFPEALEENISISMSFPTCAASMQVKYLSGYDL